MTLGTVFKTKVHIEVCDDWVAYEIYYQHILTTYAIKILYDLLLFLNTNSAYLFKFWQNMSDLE